MNATLAVGLHAGVPMADYLALPYLSSGLCHKVLTCSPYHAWYEQQHREQDDTTASDTGTAIHDALLEGIDRIQAIEAPDWRTKAAKEARDAARAAGKIPMLAAKVANVQAAVKAAREFIAGSELAGLFDDGQPELTRVWDEDGVLCKARPDWLTADRRILCHVKTTQGSAQPDAWIRNQLAPSGYDVAAAFYERGFAPGAMNSVFLVIEQNSPHGCSLIGLDPAMMELAERKVARAINIWRECQQSGEFPAYPTRICYASPTSWQLTQAEELEAADQYDRMQAEHGLQI